MKLFLLVCLTMFAFAMNSILTRMALVDSSVDAVSFGVIRLAAGAAMLVALCLIKDRHLHLGGPLRWLGVLSLLIYIYGFSLAYVSLDAGLGALVLFGVVQITMFVWGVLRNEAIPPVRWIGAGLAFGGLVWLLAPGGAQPVSLAHAALMALAGFGWGVYSLVGRQAGNALHSTAANFILAAPVALIFWLLPLAGGQSAAPSFQGIALAVIAGAVTSGLGYALWYQVLSHLTASIASVAQLTVPVIAIALGVVFLDETLTLRLVLASCVVLGGVALSLSPQFFPKRHS